jgi:large subunit ribosomal protein L4
MELPVYDEKGAKVDAFTLDESLLGENLRRKLLHQCVVRHEANQRVGTHCTKTKSEVAGSGKKPWKQKHTGRARAGMRRSPLWIGGGVTFGPKPRDYRQGMPKRMRREALKSAFLGKIKDQEVRLLQTLAYDKPKTKRFQATLKALELSDASCLVALHEPNEHVVKSIRNMQNCHVIPARNLNAYDLLKYKFVILEKDALENLQNQWKTCWGKQPVVDAAPAAKEEA